MKKKDILVLVIMIVFVGLSFLIVGLVNKKGQVAKVYLKGEIVRTIDLTTNQEYEIIEGFIVVVKNNRISVKETNCEDKTCVHMGETNSSSKPIICAPNGIYIVVDGDTEDVIVG